MRNLTGYLFPTSGPQWEEWCCHIFAEVPGFDAVLPFRDLGKKQFGVDLIASRQDGKTVAVQCKLISSGDDLQESIAEKELTKTNGLTVDLELWVIATTSKGRCLQEWAAIKNQGQPSTRVKRVKVMSWPDFERLFNLHDHLVRKFFPHLVVTLPGSGEQKYTVIEIHVPTDDPYEKDNVYLKAMRIAEAHPKARVSVRDPESKRE